MHGDSAAAQVALYSFGLPFGDVESSDGAWAFWAGAAWLSITAVFMSRHCAWCFFVVVSRRFTSFFFFVFQHSHNHRLFDVRLPFCFEVDFGRMVKSTSIVIRRIVSATGLMFHRSAMRSFGGLGEA